MCWNRDVLDWVLWEQSFAYVGIITCGRKWNWAEGKKNQFAIQDHRIVLANLMENYGAVMALQSGPLLGWGDQDFYTLTLISHWMLDTLRRNTNLRQIGSLQMRHSLKGLNIDMDFPRIHIFSKADNRTKNPENWESSEAAAVQVKKESRSPDCTLQTLDQSKTIWFRLDKSWWRVMVLNNNRSYLSVLKHI